MTRKSDLQRLPSGDIHPAYVKAALAVRGFTLTGLAKRHHRHSSFFRVALLKPFPKASRLIARALDCRPHELWPTLFDEQDIAIKRRRATVSTPKHSTKGRQSAVAARA